jgi:Ni/Fe-hydrogenase subunit HybB-like protein
MLLYWSRFGGEIMESLHSFLFPNEIHITWTVMIVLYPYITGMVAGAFIVSSF